jgi:RecA/RadA recombinase
MPVMSTVEEARAVQARDGALQGALTYIERKLGKGLVMRMSDETARGRFEVISTGALSLAPLAQRKHIGVQILPAKLG